MGLFIVVQVALDLAFLAIVTLIFVERSKARRQEDAKLSRGLQLLTSKTAVLQDLMDRTEVLGRQLTQLMDRKQDEIQSKLEEVHVHLHKVQLAMQKSKEVAQIFQDKIPHEEIIERQNTMKYMQAAKLANQGVSLDEIAKQVDVPRGELELIVKLNREKLIVQDEPEWAKVDDFKQTDGAMHAVQQFQDLPAPVREPIVETVTYQSYPQANPQVNTPASPQPNPNVGPKVKPVVFKKISLFDGVGY